MSTETKLPEGLQLALNMLDGIGVDNDTAIDAIQSEHQRRVTLQHNACDQAQRIAELEAERDDLRARLDAAAGQEPVVWQSKFTTDTEWSECARAHFDHVRANPLSWPDYEVRALYAAPVPAQAGPDGWRLVPVEPTDAMLTAASRASMQHLIDCINDPALADQVGSEEMCKRTHGERYKAMIAAAPEAAR